MPELDPETRAIGEITTVVSGLEEEQRGRLIRYIVDRYKIGGTTSKSSRSDSEEKTPAKGQQEF